MSHVQSAVSIGEMALLGILRVFRVPYRENTGLANATPRPRCKRVSELQMYFTRHLVFSESPRSIPTPQTCLDFSKGLSAKSTLSVSIRDPTNSSHPALKNPYSPGKYVVGLRRSQDGDFE